MKKLLPIIIILTVIIISIFRSCSCSSDGSSDDKIEVIKPNIPIDKKLQQRIDSFLASTKPVGVMGMMVYDLTAQQEIYSYNSDSLMRPASCMKLLTCVTTLKKFGTKAEHKTRLLTTGTVKNDTLYGNIILKAQFDPTFQRDTLYTLVSKLQGFKALKGKVIIDMNNHIFMDHEVHWTPGDLKTRYLGLCFTGFKRMKAELQYALIARAGINVGKDDIIAGSYNPRKAKEVACFTTPFFFSVERALKVSSNINAESLLYPLGYTVSSKGNYRSNGVEVLKQFVLNDLGLNPNEECVVHDGCGLCPDDRLTPELLIAILTYAYKHPYIYQAFMKGMAVSGTDGTLHDRLYKPNVKGLIHAKTGTLTREGGISTLAGYFKGSDGHDIAFAIMNNKCPVMDGRWWQDRLCERAFLPK